MLLDLGWVFQTGNALMSRSVVDNVVIGLLPLGHSRRAAEVIAKRVLTEVGLSHRVDSQTATLSGGELQRLNVARAVAREPTVILADEPTAHLDRATATEIVDRLTSVIDSNTSVIVATHDPLVAAACSRTVDIRYGEIVNAVTDAHS